jgi:hypothetical protein
MNTIRNQNGQSTIEFIFTFAFGLSVILLIFNAAMNYTTGYIVHYATFMASRVYLTSENFTGSIPDGGLSSVMQAEARAVQAFNRYNLQIFNIKPENFAINRVTGGSGAEFLTTGARTLFEQRIDVLGRVAGQKKLELVSESFLGKEPSRAACAARVCFAITNQQQCGNELDITLYDDGC